MSKQKKENQKGIMKISVRNFVEFLLREGDIDNRQGRGSSVEAMQAGSRIHRKIQKGMGANYHAEVPLRIALDQGDYELIIDGRADGILIEREDGETYTYADDYNQIHLPHDVRVTIDEIKGIYQKPELLTAPVAVHRAQAMCYAYIYAVQHDLEQIRIQMTYCNLDTQEIRYFQEEFLFEELAQWFLQLVQEYKKWADFQFEWRRLRQASIKRLVFPYEYRKGQKELASDVYRTIARRKNLFIQAPTGVGKTISTIFPAVKAVGEELGDKIFYLTAKTITAGVAKETFELLQRGGYQAKIIQITAKEKLCKCEEMDCNPVHCPYARGHYDRVNDAVYDLLQRKDVLSREVILEQADAYRVCPFELCLDAASWADNIICDYNYVFDPNVCLKRFFAEGMRGDYIFLVDEAHNLVERSRDMYSAALYKEDFLAGKKLVRQYDARLAEEFEKCNRILISYKRECETYRVYENIGSFLFALMRLAAGMDEFLQKRTDFAERKEVTEFYLKLRNFITIYEWVDERYVIYTEHTGDGRFQMKLYCVDPSLNLQKRLDKGNATIFFSATFLPIGYYKNLLSAKKDNYAVYAKTAFSESQRLLLLGRDVSSRYTRRNEAEFARIAAYAAVTARAKKGNYMIFFPSYQMMRQVYEVFCAMDGVEELVCAGEERCVESSAEGTVFALLQQPGMKEAEREAFLAAFSAEETRRREGSLAAFCVLGGIFGEGIDLKNEQLIGAVIVGTGLPQMSNERDILMHYYEERLGAGFDYAYRYPGMNKVLQAAGRVIRTVDDVGVIALLDERFLQSDSRALFPREWEKYTVCSKENVKRYLEEFWAKQESRQTEPAAAHQGAAQETPPSGQMAAASD